MTTRHPIERRRHALGLTQAMLAAKLGVSPQSVRSWEVGKGPSGTRIPAIAAALEVEPLTLRDELDQWTAPTPTLLDRPRRRRVDAPPAGA